MFKDFYKGSTIIFAGLLIGKLFAMASNVLMARLLNANYFGLFLLGLTVFNFISIPSNFGVPGIMPKFISEANSKKEYANLAYYASQGLLLTFMFSVILMIAVLFLSEWISNSFFHSAELIPVIRILAFAVPFNALIAVIISIHRGLENNYSKVILQDILLPVLKCLLFIVLFYFGLHLNAACYSFLSTNVIIFFISLFTILSVSHIKFKNFSSFNTNIIRRILKLSWPLSIQSFTWIVYSQIDRLLIGYYMAPRHVGIYVASFSIVLLLSFLPQAFSFQALPMFSKISSSDDQSTYKLAYQKISKVLFFVSFPLLVLITMFSKEILSILYGKEYISGALALAILNLGYFSRCISGPATESLISMGKTQGPMISTLVGCILNTILNIVLIPKFGISGAAVATSVSVITAQLIVAYINYRYVAIVPFDLSYIIWATTCVALGAAVYFLHCHLSFTWLILDIASSCAVYLLISYSILYFVYLQLFNNKNKQKV